MPPLVRVGRSFRGTVSLPVTSNISLSAPVEANFHFWPPDSERAAARATLLGDAQAVAARLGLPALVLECRPDRCAMGEPPLVVSAWTYAGGGAAELSLPLLPSGRVWCLTVRANGSAAATLAWNLAASAATVDSDSATLAAGRGTTTQMVDGTSSTPSSTPSPMEGGTSSNPSETGAVTAPGTTPQAAVSTLLQSPGSNLTMQISSGAAATGQVSFVLQVKMRLCTMQLVYVCPVCLMLIA